MKPILSISCLCCLLLPCCSGSRNASPEAASSNGLSSRLSQSHGYEVDDKGNWVPRHNKRSQYEGRGDSAQFRGDHSTREFDTKSLEKGSWWGSKEIDRPSYGAVSRADQQSQPSRFSGQQASLDRKLRTPARIEGAAHPQGVANESAARRLDKPTHAATDQRRKVFTEPEIIDYEQQRELSIRESKDFLGRR